MIQPVQSADVDAPSGSTPTAVAIARVAARLFAERGFDATSVREIAEAAGVTKPTLYYHFGSKQGRGEAILTRPMAILAEKLGALAADGLGGKDPLIGGGMAVDERCGGAEQIGDGASSGGEDGRAEAGDEAVKSRRVKTGERASSNG